MNRAIAFGLAVGLATCTTFSAAGTAGVRINVTDEQGQHVAGGLLVLATEQAPEQELSIDENDAGLYEGTAEASADGARWKLARIVAAGFLPVNIRGESRSRSGEVIDEIADQALSPGTAMPSILVQAGGGVTIDLTLGDQREVMQRFRAARAEARARAEEEAKAAIPEGMPTGAYAEALRLYGAGDVDGSLPHFAEAVGEHPDDPEMHLTYANVLYKAQRFEEFESAAATALKLSPDNRELMMMVYSSRRSRGDMPAALEALLAVKEQGGSAGDLLKHVDFVAKKMGIGPQAIPAYEAVLELDPGNVDASVSLAIIHAEAGNRDASTSHLERAVELAPTEAPRIYVDLGSRLLAGDDPPAARVAWATELFRKSIDADPRFSPAYKKLALALWKRQDYPGTRQAFEKYLELSPNAPDKEQIVEYMEKLPVE